MKLKRLLSGLLVSLIAIVGIAMFTKVSNAADTVVDVLTASMFKATSSSYTDFSDVSGTSGAVYAGNSAKNSSSSIQLRSSGSNSGIVATTSGGIIKKISVSWDSSTSNGRTLDIYGKSSAYTEATDLYSSSTQGKKLGSIVKGTSTELEISENYEYVGLRSNSGAMYISSISIEWGEPVVASDYNVSFDANGATFATGKGQTITTAVGTDTTLTLPTIDDLVYGCKEIMPLAGWSDGTTTHKPGEEVTVKDTTQFTAVYSEDNSKTLSVAEAKSVCDFVGSEPTTKMFSVKGVVSEINKTVVVIKDESNSELSLTLYKPETDSVEAGIKEGDKIIGTGNLLLFNSNTYELNTGCTYVKVQPTTEELFESLEIKNQLSYHWSTTDSETYTIDTVSLRFGVELTEAMTALEGAKFGAFVSNSASIIGNIETAIELEATTAAAVVEMEDTIKYLEFAKIAAPGGMTSIRIDNLDANLTGNIYVVIYMEYNGKLYITAEKVASVKSVAATYLASGIELTQDQENSLRQITE